MHSTLTEILENLQPGMLWVSRDGLVRYANARATTSTRLAAGSRVQEAALRKAVDGVVVDHTARSVVMSGWPPAPGEVAPELRCKVLPGLAQDDAMILISDQHDEHAAIGFDNLMMVLRSDLRDPLQQLHQSLLLARQEGDVHALDALCDEVDDISHVLTRLVDLAEVWSSEALLANDRIELWPLLQRAWAQVEPLARSRGIKVRFTSAVPKDQLAAMYGSEHWLQRVFLECLESAIRATRSGGTLDIEHRQMGPRVLIVLRDSGVFAPQRQDATELVGGKENKNATPQARLNSRDLVGLKLCQQVVALHGGQLREEDDDGVRNFLIDLPTGAPYRAQDAELDLAQTQRYAADLAALMARRRDTPARPDQAAS